MCCGIAGTYSILMQEKFFSGCTTCQDQILTKKEGETLNIITCYCISSIKKYQHEYSHKTCCISYTQNKIVLQYFRFKNVSWLFRVFFFKLSKFCTLYNDILCNLQGLHWKYLFKILVI